MTTQGNHRVSAILVVHDGATWLPEVVASIASQTHSVDHIIAADTGSLDASAKLLKGARIPSLSLDRSTGFGQAVNAALHTLPAPIEGASEWIWILHDDSAPAPGALEALLEAIDARPQAVMAGPKILGWHDRTHLLEIGISIAGNGARWTGLEAHEYDQGQHDGIKDVLAVSTAGALIRRDVFEELGGFDFNLALFRDDVDFGWRVRVAGHSVVAVSNAVMYHAQAAANERRSVDVEGAFLHRPHLLDRRNAAYVLLVNSAWWLLPMLTVQILSSAVARSIGYLFAKLPGYASDEILAIGALFLHPGELIRARKERKAHRMITSRVVADFIPPRFTQLRAATSRFIEVIRERVFPSELEDDHVLDPINEDEDLLTPIASPQWRSLLVRGNVIAGLALSLFTLIWSRHRFGDIAGGALSAAPDSARSLWGEYFDSWHLVGLGSVHATPPWIALIAIASMVTLGNVHLFLTIFFLVAPLVMMWSAYALLKKLTSHQILALALSTLYAISPVSIAAINSGRLATIVVLIAAPWLARVAPYLIEIENLSWRNVYAVALAFGAVTSFSMTFWLTFFGISAYALFVNYREYKATNHLEVFKVRCARRGALVGIPILINAPWSFETLLSPARLLLETGLALSGGGPNAVLFGNPGGVGSLPLWVLSPVTFLLIITLFSVTRAREIAYFGFSLLLVTVIGSSLAITGHGSSSPTRVWMGTPLAIITLAAICAGAIMLDTVRERLAETHVNYRHISVGVLAVVTTGYFLTATFWTLGNGSASPVQTHNAAVVPEFLGVDPSTKTLVLRQRGDASESALTFYISRGRDVMLGEADVAPSDNQAIVTAVRELVDGSGVTSSRTLAKYGIKNVFLKNPAPREVIRTIDGLGGFTRTSATNAGIVWKVSGITGRLIYTSPLGVSSLLDAGEVGAKTVVPGPGSITLTENYNTGWQIIQSGIPLERSKSEDGLPVFKVNQMGEFSLLHDGKIRRGWLSLQAIFLTTAIVMALPSGRRRREISDSEIS